MASNFLEGFTLQDLMSQEGITLEVDNGLNDVQEEFEYSRNVFMSNDEILKYVNLEDDQENNQATPENLLLCDVSFDKIRNKMTDILGNGKIMKLIRRNGDGDVVPPGAQVSIKYIGQFEYQDEPFDSSFSHGSAPDIYFLGQGNLLPGLDIAISTMKKNEISAFLIHQDYAYGKLGCLPRVPPEQEVLFIVNLVEFSDHGNLEDFEKLSIEEQKSFPNAKKRILSMMSAGNENFRKDKLRQAIRDYNRAVNMLEEALLANDEEEEEQKKLLSRAYCNLAVCYNKENKPRNACVACQKVPQENAKSFFHFGRALIKLGEYDRAKDQLWKARELEPFNKLILKEIRLADELHAKYVKSERRLWENCLQMTKEEAARTEFEKAAHEICLNFKNDNDTLRHPLPDGLTAAEDKIIRDIALGHGLSVTSHTRFGKEIVFLSKSNY